MRLVTWNINSIRARMHLIKQLSDSFNPDVICLQETKVHDPQFPHSDVEAMGYRYNAIKGQKGHHGVAILSKHPLTDIQTQNWCQMGDARYIAATLANGSRVHNFYVPAGGDVPDPAINVKFDHKLRFMAEMADWAKTLQNGQILVGDLNVAPYEEDVWNHKALLKVVSHTPVECDALMKIFESHGFKDVVRDAFPRPEKLFSWWSYRARDWSAADRGRRLDHIWASPDIADTVAKVWVERAARGWEKPSDHAPIIMDMT